MKKVIRQVLGIDVAQKELVVCLGRMHEDLHTELYASKIFPNTQKGFLALYHWVGKQTVAGFKLPEDASTIISPGSPVD